MTRLIALIMAITMTVGCLSACSGKTAPDAADAKNGNTQTTNDMDESGKPMQPPGEMGTPPEGERPDKMGEPPEGGRPDGMGEPPEGGRPDGMGAPPEGGPGGPGGQSSKPDHYDAVISYDADAEYTGKALSSTGKDENAVLVTGGSVSIRDTSVSRISSDSTGGDSASFYGVGAAVLATGGTVKVENCTIDTDASGGAGVFAYGDGVAYVSDCTITTKQGTSGGIHVAGGGTLYASNLTVETNGASAAAIRSDRGSGTIVVNGGSYTSNGSGSPAVYVTADITISDAELTATGSEALCLEGLNSVKLVNCNLSGNMPDQSQNDNTWTVILYQSMSGDAQIGKGSFVMEGGTLTSGNGGIFYTTNTDSEFSLKNVKILACADSEYLLRCTGNRNQRGWGRSGSNGANCVFTAIKQKLDGNVIYDSISNLTLALTENSVLTGAVLDDETCAGNGGSSICKVSIDSSSQWIATADSRVGILDNKGTILDTSGKTVTIKDASGTVLRQGTGNVVITVDSYTD